MNKSVVKLGASFSPLSYVSAPDFTDGMKSRSTCQSGGMKHEFTA